MTKNMILKKWNKMISILSDTVKERYSNILGVSFELDTDKYGDQTCTETVFGKDGEVAGQTIHHLNIHNGYVSRSLMKKGNMTMEEGGAFLKDLVG